MRISDWSSDVCSSDLVAADMGPGQAQVLAQELNEQRAGLDLARHLLAVHRHGNRGHALISLVCVRLLRMVLGERRLRRSAERRVGKECVRTCRSRLSQSHEKQKHNKTRHIIST